MRCERCDGSGIFYIGVHNMIPIKAKPNDGICYRCLGTGIDPCLTKETNNKTTTKEEDKTMKIKTNRTIMENALTTNGYYFNRKLNDDELVIEFNDMLDDLDLLELVHEGMDPIDAINKINNKKEEGEAMRNYKEMNWTEIVAYAKELGINTGHKKRVAIETELDAMFAVKEKCTEVPVGDMSSDKYYPELQEEQQEEKKSETIEEKITAAINRAKFNATYNNTPVTYIMTKSLKAIIKHNLKEEHRKHAQVDVIIERVIQKMIDKKLLYKCNDKFYGVK